MIQISDQLLWIVPYLQSAILIVGIITGMFAVSQIITLRRTRYAEDISLLYQFCVWFKAWFSFVCLIIIGSLLGWQYVYGQLICAAECCVVVGIIVGMIVRLRREQPMAMRGEDAMQALQSCKIGSKIRIHKIGSDLYIVRIKSK